MNLPLVIAMVTTAKFYQKGDSCGFVNDRFTYSPIPCQKVLQIEEILKKSIFFVFM
jgi:hypothetical protein